MAKGSSEAPRYTPIRRKLIYNLIFIIGVIAILVLPIELYRPFTVLSQLVENAKLLIAGANASLREEDLERMNAFVLRTMPQTMEDKEMGDYLFVAFTMLITEEELPESEDVVAALEEEGNEIDDFDYALLLQAADFWRERFAEDPGIQEIFQSNKKILLNTKAAARDTDFTLADLYIMLDTGKTEGAFDHSIAFVLDGYQWWEEPSYPGELTDVSSYPRWRNSAKAGRTEFDHDLMHDPNNYFMPRFTRDEWGTWFSVWRTESVTDNFNIITIDFDASRVNDTLMTVGMVVLGFFFLSLLLIVGVATLLANTFTRPITELTLGAHEVAQGNYDYQVPVFKDDELGDLTRSFNAMAADQKERLNLKSTLEKLLSKELAEMAGRHGLTLGGKRSEATLMFTDFAGFSTITQQLSPSAAVSLLNTYFETLIPVIKKYGGFPDKYIGDAIVAMFGAPIEYEDHATQAVLCAIEMQRTMRQLNRSRIKQGLPVFEMRIGINSGDVTVGAIGCDMKLEYTSIGETTNLANRMESACEIGHVMLAAGTYTRLKFDEQPAGVLIDTRPQKVLVKGYAAPVDAYRVFIDSLRIGKRKEFDAVNRFYQYAVANLRSA